MSNENMKEEKVECCVNCHGLYLVEEDMNIICRSCYTMNKVEVLSNIEEWIEKYGEPSIYGIQGD